MAPPNTNRYWKHLRATSLRHSLELSVQYAKAVHNLSVEKIAERMGMASHWRLYKWISDGNLPLRQVQSFEHSCGGCDYVTRYLGAARHKLVVDIPTGRRASETELSELQALLSEANSALVRFYRHEATSNDVLQAVEAAIGSLAYQREQVTKHHQPEFDIFGESDLGGQQHEEQKR